MKTRRPKTKPSYKMTKSEELLIALLEAHAWTGPIDDTEAAEVYLRQKLEEGK